MKLWQAIGLGCAADWAGPGAVSVPKVRADASASDVAHHHSWTEPSATDWQAIRWNAEGRGRSPLFGKPPRG